MITLNPPYDLLHCHECGLRPVLKEVEGRLASPDGTYVLTRHCPLRRVCWAVDQVELECEITRVLPRVVTGEPRQVYLP